MGTREEPAPRDHYQTSCKRRSQFKPRTRRIRSSDQPRASIASVMRGKTATVQFAAVMPASLISVKICAFHLQIIRPSMTTASRCRSLVTWGDGTEHDYSSRVNDPPVRIASDFLGPMEIPADALYGPHTARAIENFRVSGITLGDRPELIVALAHVKIAAARANEADGILNTTLADAIVAAAVEIAGGQWHDHFPIDVVQGGGGTSSNMNANEVIANRANELLGSSRGTNDPVHPNDHVNRSQSTNDVYPTALQLAAVVVGRKALNGIARLGAALEALATRSGELERIGRTCLQDAVPLPVAAGHRGQARALERTSGDLARALDGLLEVPLGATVIGTGVGATPGYRERVVPELVEASGLAVQPATNPFDALAHFDGYVDVATQMVRIGLVAGKIANDIRFFTSSPVAELSIPALQAGSSSMPGKVNPVLPELILQVSFELRGAAHAIEAAAAAGDLELNVMEPVMARHLLGGLHDLGVACELFADRCVSGLQWDEALLETRLAGSYESTMERAVTEGYDSIAKPDVSG